MKTYRILILLSAMLALTQGCKKEDIKNPDTPEITIKSVGSDSFTAEWTRPEGAERFGYALDDSPEFMTGETSASFTDLTDKSSWTFKVRSYSADGRTSDWATVPVELEEVMPAPLPVQTGKTQTSFTVEWNAVDGASGYEYRINGSETAATVTENKVTVEQDGEGNSLEAGTEYQFSVRTLSPDPDISPSAWATVTVMTEYPPFNASVDIEITDVTATSFIVKATPNEDTEMYCMTLSYSEYFDIILSEGKEELIDYLLSNIGNGVLAFEEKIEQPFEMLRPETGYVIMAVAIDRFGRSDLFYEKTETPEETVPPVESELYDILAGEWKGTQQGYAFIVPDKTENNPDPDPVLDSESELTATFDVTIVKDLGEAYSYKDHNQVCIQFKNFKAGNLDLGYMSYQDLLDKGWQDKDAREGYGPKALVDIKEDGSMSIEGLYCDTPAYTWDERYNNDVTFMNITCDPADNFMPSGDSLPLAVTLSEDKNTLTISGTMGPGFRYQRSASAGQLWCAAGDMVLTRVSAGSTGAAVTLDLSSLMTGK